MPTEYTPGEPDTWTWPDAYGDEPEDDMRVGFTGSRDGMTLAQKGAFGQWLYGREAVEFHHGCCVGADEAAAVIAYDESPFTRVIGHPGDMPGMTSGGAKAVCHEIKDPAPNLTRNRDIVDSCDVLLACPKGPEEQRSGTWATVRYARKQGKRIVLFMPDGSVIEEPAK